MGKQERMERWKGEIRHSRAGAREENLRMVIQVMEDPSAQTAVMETRRCWPDGLYVVGGADRDQPRTPSSLGWNKVGQDWNSGSMRNLAQGPIWAANTFARAWRQL